MNKKGLSLVATTVLMGGILVGCGSSESNSSSEGDKVVVEYMHTNVEQDRQEVIDGIIADFESENPDIDIKPIPVEEDALNTKVVTLASSGELPEVLEVNQDFAKTMVKDELIDQDAVKEAMETIGEDRYFDGVLNLMRTEDGESYLGVPLFGWVEGIWYNKQVLADAGFEAPTNWEELLTIAEHFTDPTNKKYGIAIPTAEDVMSEQVFSQFALSNNANALDKDGNITVDTPEMQEALTFYTDLAKYTMPGSNGVTEIKDAFMNGTVPMAVYSTYLMPSVFEENQASNLGFVLPNQKQEAAYGVVTGLTITSGLEDAEKEAAEKFVEYMSSTEVQTELVLMSPGGAQPVTSEVLESPDYQSNEVITAFGDLSTTVAEAFNNVQVFGNVEGKNFISMGNISGAGVFGKLVNEVTVGEQDVTTSLKAAQESAEQSVEN